MIDKNDYIIKIAKNGDRKKFYRTTCNKCGKDRKYKKRTQSHYLCRKCATRKSGRERATHIYTNVNYNDFIEVNAPTKNSNNRISLKYRTICTVCKKDKGYSRAKDFLKPCLSCAAKLRHSTRDPHIKEITKIKISCTQRNISIDSFKNFSTIDSEKERTKFKEGIRQECLQKADYTCDLYGIRGGILNAHHLDSWHSNEDKRFNLDNLVCLSKLAHNLFHRFYGSKNNTKEQYYDFKKIMQNVIMPSILTSYLI